LVFMYILFTFLFFFKIHEKRSDVNAKYNACKGEYRFQYWKKKLVLLQIEMKKLEEKLKIYNMDTNDSSETSQRIM